MNQNDENKEEKKKEFQNKLVNEMSKFLGIVLHKNFGINIVLQFILNLFCSMIVIGVSSQFFNLIKYYEIKGILLGILLFTLFDLFVKLIFMKYLFNFVIKSFGVIFYVTTALGFLIMQLTIPSFSFENNITSLLIFSFIFEVFKNIILALRRKIIQGGK